MNKSSHHFLPHHRLSAYGEVAPGGSSFDFECGRVIPQEVSPIAVTGDLLREGAVYDPDLESYYYPPAAGGISHFFIAWGTNSHFGPPEVAVTGSYEFTVTATDATGSGWEFMVPFEVE
jgi:hypothetical protein